jgi:hypothetical protein
MTRKQALAAIKGAGASNDQQTMLRLYVENRISYAVAMAAFRDGQRFGAWVAERDAAKAPA